MNKTRKKVHIISHSHWDREWYMSYEQHHMRLIELIDDLLELFKTDSEFNSFHLDGQSIIIDDYLSVRPEKEEELRSAIRQGKLKIGPFYILQDAFLTSSESNVRNMLIGMQESQKWGSPVMLGYFPDTFGNMGQTPQLMQQVNITTAAFGRGVRPIGFDNQILSDENYSSQFSEMNWIGPDGSKILGILFANWYSNGNEIPTSVEKAKKFWDKKLMDAEKYASTNHLLLMNGVDHQPVQKDITKAIKLANELYPDYDFIHSNFTDYLSAVKAELPKNVGNVFGELTSQETDGWFTLANTASTRVYLKQWNTKVSHQLEKIAEPLASMAYEITGKYPTDQLTYAWKTFMQNHPHDSICGCSVDEVCREMIPRFEKANEVGKYVEEEAKNQLVSEIDTSVFPKDSFPFVVFNTSGTEKAGLAKIDVEVDRIPFSSLYPTDGYNKLSEKKSNKYHVINQFGERMAAIVSDEKIRFNYDLPKDKFREPYMEKYVTVTVAMEQMPGFSWESFALVKADYESNQESMVIDNGFGLENEFIKLKIENQGSIQITDKQTNKTLSNLLIFEDVGDIGNEYVFKQPSEDQAILSTQFPFEVIVAEDNGLEAKIILKNKMLIPESANKLLNEEQEKIVDFRYRKAQRSEKKVSYVIETEISISKNSKNIHFSTKVNNVAKDHRLRVVFPTNIISETHEADSIFETVIRPNKVSNYWQNPTNPQHQQSFVNIHDNEHGVTISNIGLNEYEVVDDKICLTLLRCVGEMGDWGYFPTPDAQCIGEHVFNYAFELHANELDRIRSYHRAHQLGVPFIAKQTDIHEGRLQTSHTFIKIRGLMFEPTALKRRSKDNALILRGYNLENQEVGLEIFKDGKFPKQILNLLEEPIDDNKKQLKAYEIRTVEI